MSFIQSDTVMMYGGIIWEVLVLHIQPAVVFPYNQQAIMHELLECHSDENVNWFSINCLDRINQTAKCYQKAAV